MPLSVSTNLFSPNTASTFLVDPAFVGVPPLTNVDERPPPARRSSASLGTEVCTTDTTPGTFETTSTSSASGPVFSSFGDAVVAKSTITAFSPPRSPPAVRIVTLLRVPSPLVRSNASKRPSARSSVSRIAANTRSASSLCNRHPPLKSTTESFAPRGRNPTIVFPLVPLANANSILFLYLVVDVSFAPTHAPTFASASSPALYILASTSTTRFRLCSTCAS